MVLTLATTPTPESWFFVDFRSGAGNLCGADASLASALSFVSAAVIAFASK